MLTTPYVNQEKLSIMDVITAWGTEDSGLLGGRRFLLFYRRHPGDDKHMENTKQTNRRMATGDDPPSGTTVVPGKPFRPKEMVFWTGLRYESFSLSSSKYTCRHGFKNDDSSLPGAIWVRNYGTWYKYRRVDTPELENGTPGT